MRAPRARLVEAADTERCESAGDAVVVAPTIVGRLIGRRRPVDSLAELTQREREALELVTEGLWNGAIPGRSAITESTVKAQGRHVFSKLDRNQGGRLAPAA